MPRVHHLLGILAAAAATACAGSPTDINTPDKRPANSISIVAGAETKGTSAFNPNPHEFSIRSPLSWFNDDEQPAGGQYGGSNGTIHNIASDDGVSFVSGNIQPGGSFQHTFTAAGTYNYHCNIHPTMRGTLTVTP